MKNSAARFSTQLFLPTLPREPVFPSTRYQGSKLKIADWIWENIRDLHFEIALDAFGGTGAVSHLLKRQSKTVFYNDVLVFNYLIGLALIENHRVTLTESDIAWLLDTHTQVRYQDFIQQTFADIFFTDEENRWLDHVVGNIRALDDKYKQALAYFALFQACIAKRPYNLFHRRNLYLRTAEVERTFGNKTTWDTPFEEHFRNYIAEANAGVFDNGKPNVATQSDVFEIEGEFDLVYVDPPYVSADGVGVDYLDFYHFLEGIADYEHWADRIDHRLKHKGLIHSRSVWCDKNKIHDAFDRLFAKFRNSILVVSYRSNGIPSVGELTFLLQKYKGSVLEAERTDYQYVLSRKASQEVLLIAR
ncbi:MAG: DNA adenine methylase [Chloroflexi bacterium]|nr:DNA adenine methylase [Chloroflexota bacterium]